MELCYTNNPKSLFRKYARLVTSFANTNLGRDYLKHNNFYIPNEKIGLMLPNGYIRYNGGKEAQMIVTTRACYSSKLYSALQALDNISQWISSFGEARELLAWYLSLRHKPVWASDVLFSTLTVYPDANPETTSVDGKVGRATATEAWATIRAGAGNDVNDSEASNNVTVRISTLGLTSPNYADIFRAIFLFDTSALTANAAISSATFTLVGLSATTSNDFGGLTVRMVKSSPASNTALATSDYNIGNWPATTAQSDTEINNRSWNTSGNNDFALNSTGLGNVSKTSITKFGTMFTNDATNSEPSYAGGNDCRVGHYFADNGSVKPQLVITYALPGDNFLTSFSGGFVEF